MKAKEKIPDVLASRYVSEEMKQNWSMHNKVLLERDFWLAVMHAQKDLGIAIPEEALEAYLRVKEEVDLDRIAQREQKLRHDVKARIEEFCELAGHQQIHKGLTSRDLTDNVEQLQILQSLKLVRVKTVAALNKLSRLVEEYKNLVLVARTHNVPAQLSSVGRRLAMFGEEVLLGLEQLDLFIESYPLRGLKGAVGTRLDLLQLFEGKKERLEQLDQKVAEHLGASRTLLASGQVYPRSLDLQMVQHLMQISSGMSNFAKTLRLMAGAGLASEGFQKNQVGSSAMPHKQNARTSERISGLHHVLSGYGSMLSGLSGDQWNEGDVSCSVVRRVALPGAFFAIDGQLEAWLTVLNEMGFDETALQAELEKNLPFVCSTVLLMESVKRGGGREDAHHAIREHTLNLGTLESSEILPRVELARRLGEDVRVPLTEKEISDLLDQPQNWLGNAPEQAQQFVEKTLVWSRRFPESKSLEPEPLL